MADDKWLDQPLLRPYTMTRGRTRPAGAEFDLVAIVQTRADAAQRASGLAPECWRLLQVCLRPTSVADAASDVGLPLSVVRVLLGDLREQGLVTLRAPAPVTQLPRARLLREVIQGLKAL